MPAIAGLLTIFGLVFGLPGLFFGRAAWFGRNSRTIPVRLLLEMLALVVLILGIATRVSVSWNLPLLY